jgi:hypothetical protein
VARSRISIAGLSFVVAIIAADFAILRYLLTRTSLTITGHEPLGFVLVSLPIATALMLGLPRLIRRRAGSFLVGFEAIGWLSVSAYGLGSWLYPETLSTYWVQPVFSPVYNALAEWSAFDNPPLTDAYMWFVMFPLTSCCLSLPLWFIAVAGGFLFRLAGRRGSVLGAGPPTEIAV